MRNCSLVVGSAATLLLASCGEKEEASSKIVEMVGGSPPSVETVSDGVDRPLFDEAQKHLRFGGDYYAYTYVGDSYGEIAQNVDEWLVKPFLAEEIANQGMDMDAARLAAWLGVDQVTAMGASSHKSGDVYETRRVLVLKSSEVGVWNLMGAARPALSANVFSDDVAASLDLQLDLTGAREWLGQLKPMIGEEGSQQLDQLLAQGAGQETVGEMIDAMNIRFSMGLALHEETSVEWNFGDEAITTPDADLIICMEGLTKNFDEIRTVVSSNPDFEKVDITDGVSGYVLKEAVPVAMENLRPVIAYDEANNRIFMCSRLSYLEATLTSGSKLKDNPAYQSAMKDMPTDVLSKAYFSKQAGDVINALLDSMQQRYGDDLNQVAAAAANQAAANPDMSAMAEMDAEKVGGVMDKLTALRKRYLGVPWVSVTAQDGNSVYTVTRTPLNGRPLTLGGNAYAMMTAYSMAATIGFSGYNKFTENAQLTKDVFVGKNFFNVATSYALDNQGDFPADLDELYAASDSLGVEKKDLQGDGPDGTWEFELVDGLSQTMRGSTVLAYSPEDSRGFRVVVTISGKVEALLPDKFEELMDVQPVVADAEPEREIEVIEEELGGE